MADLKRPANTTTAVRSTASFLLQHVPVVPPRDVKVKAVARPPSFAEIAEPDGKAESQVASNPIPVRKGEDLLPWSVAHKNPAVIERKQENNDIKVSVPISPKLTTSRQQLVADLNQFGRQGFRPISNYQQPQFETVSGNYKPGTSAWEPTMYSPHVQPPEVSTQDINNVADLLRQANVIGNTKKVIRSGSPVIHVHHSGGGNQLSYVPSQTSPGAVSFPSRVQQVVHPQAERSNSPVVRYHDNRNPRSESVQAYVHPGVPYTRRGSSESSMGSRDPSPVINYNPPPHHVYPANQFADLPLPEMIQTPPGGDMFHNKPHIRTPPPIEPVEQPYSHGGMLEGVEISNIEPAEGKYSSTQFKVEQPYSDGENDPQRFSPGRFGATRQANMTISAGQLPYAVSPVSSNVILASENSSFGINYNTTPGAVFITSLHPGGASEKAGVPKQGRLVAINGIGIKEPSDIQKAVSVSPHPLNHQVVVDTGYAMSSHAQVARNHENWIGMKVTVISDTKRLLNLIMNHGGLVCQTQSEMAVYRRLAGLSGILIDYNTPEARILARFPKAGSQGESVEAWVPLTTIKEFESLPEVDKIRRTTSDAAIIYDFAKEEVKLKSAVKTPREDVDIFSKDYRKKVQIQEPNPELREKLEGLPLMNPDEEIVEDLRVKYEYERKFAPADKKFPMPKPRDYSPERIDNDLHGIVDDLTLEADHTGGVSKYLIPGTNLAILASGDEISPQQAGGVQQPFPSELLGGGGGGGGGIGGGAQPSEPDPLDEKPVYQNTYGFDPEADGVFLKKPSENLRPPDSNQPQGDLIYPPPHYPHRRDSEESEGESEETLLEQLPMDIQPQENDRNYVESLQSFQDEMRSYYYKVGPGKYKVQVSGMLTGQDPSGRGCPPELRRIYEKQLELLVDGKNPFKEQRFKGMSSEVPPHDNISRSDVASVPEVQPPPPEDPPPIGKKDQKKSKKKKDSDEPPPATATTKKSKKPKEELVEEELVKSSKPKPKAKKKSKTPEEEAYEKRLDDFNTQMKQYYTAAGNDVYLGHVQGLVDTQAVCLFISLFHSKQCNIIKKIFKQIPEELQDLYDDQLTALKAGKDPWVTKKKKKPTK